VTELTIKENSTLDEANVETNHLGKKEKTTERYKEEKNTTTNNAPGDKALSHPHKTPRSYQVMKSRSS
jgi:hypothetical protein